MLSLAERGLMDLVSFRDFLEFVLFTSQLKEHPYRMECFNLF